MGKHNQAVQKIARKYRLDKSVKKVYADNINKYPDPPISAGGDDHVPDVFVKFSNGREKIIEVDTKPMSDHAERQDRAFQRSANSKPNVRSYDHYFAREIL